MKKNPISISLILLSALAMTGPTWAAKKPHKTTVHHKALAKTKKTTAAKAEAALKVDFSANKGSMSFHAVAHPSALNIDGSGAAPQGMLTWDENGKIKGDLTMDLTSLDAGISMRTNHMKNEYLQVKKFPQAKLTITDLTLPKGDFSKDFSDLKVPFKGNLLLHGETKPVSGTATIGRQGGTSTVKAEFTVKYTDYGITQPTFAGITVDKTVSVAVTGTASLSKM